MPIGVRVVTIFVWSRLTSVAASLARGGGGLGESRAGNEGSRRLVRRRVKLAGILALSERQASNQRNQRESSDKHLHDTSPCYGRSSVGCCNSGEADGDRQRDALARRGRQRAFAERAGQAEVALQRGGAVGDETEQVGQCFWLSPSITTRSPGSMIASSNRVARFAGQTFPLAPHTAAARASRGGRSGSCRDGSNIAKLLRFLLSSAAKGGSRSLITEMIFYNIIDREYGLMPCWILSCCAPSLPWLSAAAFTERPSGST